MIGLILIGFFVGFFTHRQLTVNRKKQIVELRKGPVIQRHLLVKIDLSSQQKEQIQPIVQEFAQRMDAIHRESRSQRRAATDSLQASIKKFLTSEQIQKLEDISRHFRGRPGSKRRPGKKMRVREKTKD